MMSFNNLLLISADAKHSGKTTLACKLIQNFSSKFEIIAIKISVDENVDSYSILEESKKMKAQNDTQRMLKSGAKTAFFLKSDASNLLKGFEEIFDKISIDACVICESLSLRKYLEPGLMINIKSENKNKKHYKDIGELANIQLNTFEVNEFSLNEVEFMNNEWKSKK